MDIHFGLSLDGQRGRQPANRLGDTTLGPLGFLSMLEGLLGLQQVAVPEARRIAQYRDCLEQANITPRFYSKSLAVDPLGTSARLLAWRDLWHLHGWSRHFATDASRRLCDLDDVEALAVTAIAPSLGERLHAVAQAMRGRRLPIDRVTLYDPLEAFPSRWQDVLSALPVMQASIPLPTTGSLLGELQSALSEAQADREPRPIVWRDDGSLRLVRAETRLAAARWLANDLGMARALLVAETGATLLDRTFETAGVPRPGLKESTAFRPSLQLSPLALRLLWRPADIHTALEFLSHPICPIRSYARRKLAAKLADQPGIGGASWKFLLDGIAAHYQAEAATAVLDSIRYWIECERYEPAAGIPVPVVAQRIDRLGAFFRSFLANKRIADVLAARDAVAQCADVLDSLRHMDSADRLTPPQLDKLLLQATARGSGNSLLKPQAGSCLAIDAPASAIEPAEHVVWWQLAMPAMPETPPWSQDELGQLAAAGIALPSMDQQLRWLAETWLRPVLAARCRLTLILPPVGTEAHPLWQMIAAILPDPQIHAVEDVLVDPEQVPLPATPLPAMRRWWKLPAGSVPRRARESHSSVSIFLNNPYHWVLRYPAALKLSRTLDVADGPRLYGLLAHRIVERFFKEADWKSLSDAGLEVWFETTFSEVIDEQGAVLRLPGKRAELSRCHHVARRALLTLRRHFLDAGVVKVESESELSGTYPGGWIGGSADLVVTRADGRMGVIDMKWSGEGRYSAKLEKNAHLQLAIYGELLRQKHGRWPMVGYYILNVARLFAHDTDFFGGAVATPGKEGNQTARLWQQFAVSWNWRDAQLQAGAIEVVMTGSEPDDDSEAPDGALPIEKSQAQENASYNDYATLAGWRGDR